MRVLLFAIALAICLIIAPKIDASTLKISIGTGDIVSAETYRAVIEEAYKRTGNQVEFLITPTFRSADLVVAGQAVAEAVRIEDFIVINSKLSQIPVVIGSINISVLSMQPFTEKITKHSMVNARVGTLKNFYFLENYMPFQTFLWMNSLDVLVKKLVSGQLDYIIYTSHEFNAASKNWYPDIKFFEKPLLKRNLFHYVSKNRTDLVGPLTKAFQAMVDDGYIMREIEHYGHKVGDCFLRHVQ